MLHAQRITDTVMHNKARTSFEMICLLFPLTMYNRGGAAVGWSVGPESARLGVRIPASTDLSRKNR